MAGLSPTPKQQIFGSDGAPLVGGKIYTYAAGTTTPAATYTDYSAGTANTNPIILDSYGQANIWLLSATSYKFVVKTATDTLLYTVDNISTPLDISALASPPPIGNTTPNTGAFTTLTASGAVTLTGLGAMKLNAGTTADRPTPSNGMIRYNTSTALMEGYINSAWKNLALGDAVVTSVATGTGLTGGPITSTGTIAIDSTVVTLTGTQTLTNKTIQGGAITSGTVVASTSGTAINFTGIPSWAKRITVMFQDVSTNGTAEFLLQIGTAAGIQSSGYVGASSFTAAATAGARPYSTAPASSTGFAWFNSVIASELRNGSAVLTLLNATTGTWALNGMLGNSNDNFMVFSAGSKTLSATLERLRITTTNGTDTFDNGSINILYE